MTYHILLVEDDASNAQLIQTMCRHAGYTVDHAPDGVTALEMIRGLKVDLVLLDLQLPNLDGLGVLRRVRSTPETARLPVVVVTAQAHAVKVEPTVLDGANEVLIKPFRLGELKECLRRVLPDASDQA